MGKYINGREQGEDDSDDEYRVSEFQLEVREWTIRHLAECMEGTSENEVGLIFNPVVIPNRDWDDLKRDAFEKGPQKDHCSVRSWIGWWQTRWLESVVVRNKKSGKLCTGK
jgi:hypothetical protein